MGVVGTIPGGGKVTVTGLSDKDIRNGVTVTVQQGNRLIAEAHGSLALKRVQLGPSPCDIKTLLPEQYMDLTIDNFVLAYDYSSIYVGTIQDYDSVCNRDYTTSFNPSKKYDASTGVFTYSQNHDEWFSDRVFSKASNGHQLGQAHYQAGVTAYLFYVE